MKSIAVQAKKVSEQFQIPESWELVRYLGSGAYASVAAFRVGGVDVAVKKVNGVFDHPVLALRTLREVRLLRHLQHPNVLSIRELFVEGPDFKDAYICLERMDADLAQLIQSHKEKGQVLTDYQTQCIVYQIMRGMFCLRMAAVIHRDLKPSNILIKAARADSSEGNVKIADLGLARSVDAAEDSHDVQALTEYVVTRFYRAPEVVLTATHYTYAVDIWSVGCIMGEMLSGDPLFKGKDSLDQIRKIVSVLGMPSEEDMSWIPVSSPSWKFVMRCNQSKGNGEAFRRLLDTQDANPSASELLAEMLKFDPSRRISVEQALHHRYLEAFRPSSDPEVSSAREIGPVDWSFDRNLCFDEDGQPKPFDVLRFREEFLKCCTRIGAEAGPGDSSDSPGSVQSPMRQKPRVERRNTPPPAGRGYLPASLPAVPPAGAPLKDADSPGRPGWF